MGYQYLQGAAASSGTAVTTLTATFANNVQAGSKIIVFTTTSSVTATPDAPTSGAFTWTAVGAVQTGTPNGALCQQMFFLDVTGALINTKPAINIIYNASTTCSMSIIEVSGLLPGNTTACLDGSQVTKMLTGAASEAQPAYTSSAAGEFFAVGYGDNGGPASYSCPAGYQADNNNAGSSSIVNGGVNDSGTNNCVIGYKATTGGAEGTPNWTLAGSPTSMGSGFIAVAFQLAPAGGGGPVRSPFWKGAKRWHTQPHISFEPYTAPVLTPPGSITVRRPPPPMIRREMRLQVPRPAPVIAPRRPPQRPAIDIRHQRGQSQAVPAIAATPGIITYNTGTSGVVNNAASIAITIPSGVLTNDAMILNVQLFCETGTAPTLSFSGGGGGWTAMTMSTGTNPESSSTGSGVWDYGYAYYRVATSGDPGATLTITESGSTAGTTWFAVTLASYTGASTTTPIDIAGGANNAASGTSVTCPTLSTGSAGDWAIFIGGGGVNDSSVLTGPTGSTSRQNTVSSAGIGAADNDSNGSVGAAGTSIGGGTFTTNVGPNSNMTAFTIGLKPAAAAPPAVLPPVNQRIRIPALPLIGRRRPQMPIGAPRVPAPELLGQRARFRMDRIIRRQQAMPVGAPRVPAPQAAGPRAQFRSGLLTRRLRGIVSPVPAPPQGARARPRLIGLRTRIQTGSVPAQTAVVAPSVLHSWRQLRAATEMRHAQGRLQILPEGNVWNPIYDTNPTPGSVASDSSSYTFGLSFSVSTSCYLNGVWWYCNVVSGQYTNSLHDEQIALWTVTGAGTGNFVPGTVTPAGFYSQGWNLILFSSPILLTPGEYMAAKGVSSAGGGGLNYTQVSNYFSTGPGARGFAEGPVQVFSGTGGAANVEPNGNSQQTFYTGTTNSPPPSISAHFPNGTFQVSWYGMDVQLTALAQARPAFVPPQMMRRAVQSLARFARRTQVPLQVTAPVVVPVPLASSRLPLRLTGIRKAIPSQLPPAPAPVPPQGARNRMRPAGWRTRLQPQRPTGAPRVPAPAGQLTRARFQAWMRSQRQQAMPIGAPRVPAPSGQGQRARYRISLRAQRQNELVPPSVVLVPPTPPQSQRLRARLVAWRTRGQQQTAPPSTVIVPVVTGAQGGARPRLAAFRTRSQRGVPPAAPRVAAPSGQRARFRIGTIQRRQEGVPPRAPGVPSAGPRRKLLTGALQRRQAQRTAVPQAPLAPGRPARGPALLRRPQRSSQFIPPTVPVVVPKGNVRTVLQRFVTWFRRRPAPQLAPKAVSGPTHFGSAALSAQTTLFAYAATTTGLGNLWAIYLNAKLAADTATQLYLDARMAGGYEVGTLYFGKAYQLQMVAGQAYENWYAAWRVINPAPPSGPPQLPPDFPNLF